MFLKIININIEMLRGDKIIPFQLLTLKILKYFIVFSQFIYSSQLDASSRPSHFFMFLQLESFVTRVFSLVGASGLT